MLVTPGRRSKTVDYSDLVARDALLADVSMPQVTLPPVDADARRAFLDRAAELWTRLVPPRTWLTAQQLLDVVTRIMGDVERYKTSARLRANVLNRVLDLTADQDELIIIGLSLGSVVAVDALSYLPGDLHVPLLITMESPLFPVDSRDRPAGPTPPVALPSRQGRPVGQCRRHLRRRHRLHRHPQLVAGSRGRRR
jgi:hypothetical protein